MRGDAHRDQEHHRDQTQAQKPRHAASIVHRTKSLDYARAWIRSWDDPEFRSYVPAVSIQKNQSARHIFVFDVQPRPHQRGPAVWPLANTQPARVGSVVRV